MSALNNPDETTPSRAPANTGIKNAHNSSTLVQTNKSQSIIQSEPDDVQESNSKKKLIFSTTTEKIFHEKSSK